MLKINLSLFIAIDALNLKILIKNHTHCNDTYNLTYETYRLVCIYLIVLASRIICVSTANVQVAPVRHIQHPNIISAINL